MPSETGVDSEPVPERTFTVRLDLVVRGPWAHTDNAFLVRQVVDLIENNCQSISVRRRAVRAEN